MIQPGKIRSLNDQPRRKGRYVLYWMQAAQRAQWNEALEFAIQQANELDVTGGRSLLSGGRLPTGQSPPLPLHAPRPAGDPATPGAIGASGWSSITDRRKRAWRTWPRTRPWWLWMPVTFSIQRAWRSQVARRYPCAVVRGGDQSDRARCGRPVTRKTSPPRPCGLESTGNSTPIYSPFRHPRSKKDSLGLRLKGLALEDIDVVLAHLKIDRRVRPVRWMDGRVVAGQASPGRRFWPTNSTALQTSATIRL